MPYTYLIGWKDLNLWYYGVRYSQKAYPEDLWKTYFTSSKKVKEIREKHGEPDVIEVRKKFATPEKAILWESKVLKRMKCSKRKDFLNIVDNTGIVAMYGKDNPMSREDVKLKHLEACRKLEHRLAISKGNKGKKKRNVENYKGPKSKEHKEKMSISAKKRPRKECDKCGQFYTKANFVKHYNSCKGIKQKMYKKLEDGSVRRV